MATESFTIYYTPALARGSDRALFSHDQITAAVRNGLILLQDGVQLGEAKYPRAYKKYPSAQTHAQAPFFEFPILHDGALYDGTGSPGPDFVVFGSVATDYRSADYVCVASAAAPGGAEDTGSAAAAKRIVHPDTSVNKDDEHASAFEKGLEGHKYGHGAHDTVLTPPAHGRELIHDSDVKIAFSE